jgi:uncharacterized protein YoxC
MPSSVSSTASSNDGDNDTLIDFQPSDENDADASLKNAMKLAWADRYNSDLRATVKRLKARNRELEAENKLLRLHCQETQTGDDATVNELRSELQAARDDRNFHMAEHTRILKEKNATSELLNGYFKAIKNAEEDAERHRVTNDTLKYRNDDLEKVVKELRSDIEGMQDETKSLQDKAKSAEERKEYYKTQTIRLVGEKKAINESLSKSNSSIKALQTQIEEMKREKREITECIASSVVDLDIVASGYRVWCFTHAKGIESISKKDLNESWAGVFRANYQAKALFYRFRNEDGFIYVYHNRQNYHQDHAFYHEKQVHFSVSFADEEQAASSELWELCKFSIPSTLLFLLQTYIIIVQKLKRSRGV